MNEMKLAYTKVSWSNLVFSLVYIWSPIKRNQQSNSLHIIYTVSIAVSSSEKYVYMYHDASIQQNIYIVVRLDTQMWYPKFTWKILLNSWQLYKLLREKES